MTSHGNLTSPSVETDCKLKNANFKFQIEITGGQVGNLSYGAIPAAVNPPSMHSVCPVMKLD